MRICLEVIAESPPAEKLESDRRWLEDRKKEEREENRDRKAHDDEKVSFAMAGHC
jgi:hypothetical protein